MRNSIGFGVRGWQTGRQVALLGMKKDLQRVKSVACAGKTLDDPAETIAADPIKLALAGRLISQASTRSYVRYETVAALREQIEAGTYSVDAEDLADRLMDSMRI